MGRVKDLELEMDALAESLGDAPPPLPASEGLSLTPNHEEDAAGPQA